MPRKNSAPGLTDADTRAEPLVRGKWIASRYPMLATHPEIDPGQTWPQGAEVPEGFRLDKSGHIWPVAVAKGNRIPADEKRCIANKKDGTGRCTNPRLPNRTTCRMHGGEERAGIAHPKARTGKSFRNGIFGDCGLPKALSDWYQRAIEDPGIYDLTHNIAIISGRERELLGGLSTGESKAAWRTASDMFDQFVMAAKLRDTDKMNAILPRLQKIMNDGRKDTEIYAEFVQLGERKRRLIETHRKRQLDLKMVVSAEQLRGILRAFTLIVFEEINGIPALVQTLVRKEGKMDTGRLCQALIARIGGRMGTVSQGMKSGRLSDEHQPGNHATTN